MTDLAAAIAARDYQVRMMNDLAKRFEDMVAAAGRQSLLVFPGYLGDDLPTVWWQGDPEEWPDFLGIAKAEGQRTLFVGRTILQAEDLQELADWVEERTGPGSTNGDRARLKEFERYIGLTGEVRIGWIKDGVAYLLQHRTDWYEEFLDLMDEVQEDNGLSDFHHED